MNLGEQLKAIKERSIAETNRQRIEREALTDMKTRHTFEQVQLFFRQAREKFESDIATGEAPKPIPIGKAGHPYAELRDVIAGYGMTSLTIENPKHTYHFVWQGFDSWARENGLKVALQFDHDGVGMSSWHNLTVKPA